MLKQQKPAKLRKLLKGVLYLLKTFEINFIKNFSYQLKQVSSLKTHPLEINKTHNYPIFVC